MPSAEFYRKKAAGMRRRAQSTETSEHRDAWTTAANKWDAMADEIESFSPSRVFSPEKPKRT